MMGNEVPLSQTSESKLFLSLDWESLVLKSLGTRASKSKQCVPRTLMKSLDSSSLPSPPGPPTNLLWRSPVSPAALLWRGFQDTDTPAVKSLRGGSRLHTKLHPNQRFWHRKAFPLLGGKRELCHFQSRASEGHSREAAFWGWHVCAAWLDLNICKSGTEANTNDRKKGKAKLPLPSAQNKCQSCWRHI